MIAQGIESKMYGRGLVDSLAKRGRDWERHDGSAVELHIFHGGEAKPAQLLYDSAGAGTPIAHSLFHQRRTISFGGGQWLLEFVHLRMSCSVFTFDARPANLKDRMGALVRHARTIALALLLGFSDAAASEEVKIGGTGAALRTMQLLADEFAARHPDVRVTIAPSLGSGGGIRAVLAGAIGLAVTSRSMDESERKLGAVETEYARTPFVFAVSTKSRVSAITSVELADIYTGKTATWTDGTPVRVVLRPPSDIDTEMVKRLSPEIGRGLLEAEARRNVQYSLNDQDAADDLERITGAIGPSSLAVILSEKRALRALKLDGRAPTLANLASGAYPNYKRLFFVTGAQRSAAVERFIAFVQSPAGRTILARNGHWIP